MILIVLCMPDSVQYKFSVYQRPLSIDTSLQYNSTVSLYYFFICVFICCLCVINGYTSSPVVSTSHVNYDLQQMWPLGLK